MKRDTKEITTPVDKHKVVIKTWLTGRETRELRGIILKGMKFSITAKGEARSEGIDSSKMIEEAENRAIEIIVVSVNGETEGIVDKILDMKGEDYDFVMSEINKVSGETAFLMP